jgi:hypothetical protein
MAGRKYGFIVYARTPPGYAAMSPADRAKPGRAFEQTLKQYQGKVEVLRRYWTSAFTHEASDVFVFECDDPADAHAFQEDLDRALAKAAGSDPNRFGATVHVTFGINPDAEAQAAPARRRGGRAR